MDKDQAIQEVQEIKQVMDEARQRSNRRNYWILPVCAIAAMIVSALIPPLAPIIGVGFLVSGIIIWRRSGESIIKALAAGMVGIGIMMLLMTLFVVLGLMAYHTSGVTVITTPIPR